MAHERNPFQENKENHSMISIRRHLPRLAMLIALALLLTGCDPTINLYGTFIPAWLVCMAVGTVGAVTLRYLLAALKLEPYLGPLILVYPCLVLLLSCAIWVIFFKL
jgi:hypothetical protein